MSRRDFDFEPVRGLPAKLPPDELLLWQGAPDWWQTARRVFHVPVIAGYLGAFLLWKLVTAVYDGAPAMETVRSVALMVLLIAACCGILCALAYAVARTTVYSLTSERVVMRYGIALPMALNIPFGKIDTAAVKDHGGGFGDVRLTLAKHEKIAWLMLWPHARPWRFKHPEPMLRGVADVATVAAILGQSLAASASRPAARAATSDAPTTVAASAPSPMPAAARPQPEPIARLA